MKKNKVFLFALMCMAGISAQALEKDANSVYQIGTSEDMVAFAQLVNNGEVNANAVLIADIDMSGVENFTPIAKHYTSPYSGIFDGQGHIISNLNIDMNAGDSETGLFFRVTGATIKNLGVVNATVKNPSAYRVGVLGGAAVSSNIISCFSTGSIELENESRGGLFGLIGTGTVVSNCYTTYESVGFSDNGNIVNTYWGGDANRMAPTGELCYMLNGDQSEIAWYQNIGQDEFPILDATHGKVYPTAERRCDGKILGEGSYINDVNQASSIPEHIFENGTCTVCGQADPDFLRRDADGFYQIGTAGHLVAFSQIVNNGEVNANAVLIADIDMSGVDNFTPIAKHYTSPYTGVFDGQGHIISNLNIDMNAGDSETGLFFRVTGATIKNLGVVNAIVKNPSAYRVGVLGGAAVSSNVINCFSVGAIELDNTSRGGLFGLIQGTLVSNCYTTYESVGFSDNGNIVNTYWGEEAVVGASSGELCYKLNGDQSEITWYQNIGQDSYPILDVTHGTVYPATEQRCDGTFIGELTFTNDPAKASKTPDHKFENNICTVCGQVDTSVLYPDENGVYQIGTAEALVLFSKLVNKGEVSANAVLTADIDMSGVDNFTPIAKHYTSPYSGVFDGQGHIISNLTIDMNAGDSETGLFFRVTGATIKNLGVVNAIVKNPSAYRVGVLGGAAVSSNIINCFSAGSIELENESRGGLFGLIQGTLVSNCYTTYESVGFSDNGNIMNTYCGEDANRMAPIGELCTLLNTESNVFRQTIGEDPYPIFDPTHGIVKKITDAGYATMYIPETSVTIPTGVEAYTGTINGELLILNPLQDVVIKGQAVVLKGNAGYYSFIPVDTGVGLIQSDLLGTSEPLEANGTQYVLAQKDDVIGFYKAEGTIAAGKAYLDIADGSVKGFALSFDGETSIKTIDNGQLTMDNAVIYDLSGRRVEKMQKGIYIVNGKKMLK